MELEQTICAILDAELIPALGCTEPVAFGLCAAAARTQTTGEIQEILCEASPAMIKGVQSVMIPRSGGQSGGKMACALGALAGRMEDGMEVFQRVLPEHTALAKALVTSGAVKLRQAEIEARLWVRVTVRTSEGSGCAIVQDRHDAVVYLSRGDTVCFDRRTQPAASEVPVDYSVLSVSRIVSFCREAPMESLARPAEAAVRNWALCEEGLQGRYGMQVGRTLMQGSAPLLGDGFAMEVIRAACAGVDARMAGAPLPAMSNSGSGNQGLTCTAPVVAAGRLLERPQDEIVRAVAVANLMTILVKTQSGPDEGRMSPACCAAFAAGGAACGIGFLRGDGADCLERVMQTVLGNVCGLICDGAKANCAAKVGMALHGALQALVLAEAGLGADARCGIVDCTLPQTIRNVFRLQREAMPQLERVLCRIEAEKAGGLH